MVITGTSKGLGKQLASFYSNQGFLVFGCSRSNIDYNIENYQHFTLDICDESEVKRMFTYIRKNFGRLDVLINNAGIASNNYVLLTSLKEAQEVLNTNFLGTFLFCREAIKLMKRKNFGRIVTFSSIHVPFATLGTSMYGASKASLVQFSNVLAQEVIKSGITVNLLELSVVRDSGMAEAITDVMRLSLLEQTASGEELEMSDVTNVIDFFISHENSKVTNQILSLG